MGRRMKLISRIAIAVIVLAIAGFCFGKDAAQHELFNEVNGMVGKNGGEAIQHVNIPVDIRHRRENLLVENQFDLVGRSGRLPASVIAGEGDGGTRGDDAAPSLVPREVRGDARKQRFGVEDARPLLPLRKVCPL